MEMWDWQVNNINLTIQLYLVANEFRTRLWGSLKTSMQNQRLMQGSAAVQCGQREARDGRGTTFGVAEKSCCVACRKGGCCRYRLCPFVVVMMLASDGVKVSRNRTEYKNHSFEWALNPYTVSLKVVTTHVMPLMPLPYLLNLCAKNSCLFQEASSSL